MGISPTWRITIYSINFSWASCISNGFKLKCNTRDFGLPSLSDKIPTFNFGFCAWVFYTNPRFWWWSRNHHFLVFTLLLPFHSSPAGANYQMIQCYWGPWWACWHCSWINMYMSHHPHWLFMTDFPVVTSQVLFFIYEFWSSCFGSLIYIIHCSTIPRYNMPFSHSALSFTGTTDYFKSTVFFQVQLWFCWLTS